ncbi:hypothetical protein, partial [Streptomyces sp. CNQ085]|uniref:DNA-directed RNA polymerase subunit beta n=1 Tax=Streptomyces sp. CNQ085 TaxID=2886944 RepID=UPI001F50FDB2
MEVWALEAYGAAYALQELLTIKSDAVTGAVLLRRWDREAGRRVGEVRAARATAEWRAEERQAELENELEESLELRRKTEDTLRSKRAELERLRTEHAALLRRYATAETERASALEGRRQLVLETAGPAKELTTGAADHRRASGAPTPLTYVQADEALRRLRANAARQREREAPAVPAPEPGAPRPSRSAPPRQDGTAAGAREPYGQGSGSRGGGAPRRGGFDFFGTQSARQRRRTPGTQGRPETDSPSGRDRTGAPGDAPDGGAGPASGAAPRTGTGPAARAASPAVAGKVIDLGEPGDEAGDGGADAGGTPRSTGPVRGLRRARSA